VTIARTLPALKEWALVCRLLLQGRQAVLLRKGGIDEKGFWVEADEFLLYPTYFHQMVEKVRPEFAEECRRALAEAPPEGIVRLPGVARVVDHVEARRPEGMAALRDLHPYTDEQVETRIAFRPRKPLVLLVVEVRPTLGPVEVTARPEFAGCVSWVDAGIERPPLGDPVLPEEALGRIASRVRDAVG
jgi:hypothetical protein